MWLEDLKVGDIVIVVETYTNRKMISQIREITETIMITDGRKFYKHSGTTLKEHEWYPTFLEEATEGTIILLNKESLKRKLVARLHNVDWNQISMDTLKKVNNLIKLEVL